MASRGVSVEISYTLSLSRGEIVESESFMNFASVSAGSSRASSTGSKECALVASAESASGHTSPIAINQSPAEYLL